ncbi:MAG: (d)CMP kinase [Methylophilaceae bacterium]|nr:(d)CMP kinase [Methylophilaceae bacterium]
MANPIPVIAIDGPSASGKGTVAQLVAKQLGYHYLDSGALYRIVALAAHKEDIAWNEAADIASVVPRLDIRFEGDQIFLDGENVSDQIRTELMGQGASQVAAHPQVRSALTKLQHTFRKAPGLVADGRDMATVIFPDAITKIFLTASAEVRAERRYQQLVKKGVAADYAAILKDLQDRDARDSTRAVAPLKQAPDAELLDTSHLNIEEAVSKALALIQSNSI